MGARSLQPLRMSEREPGVKLLTPGREWARLDVTHGHDGPYLGAHVANSVRQANTVLSNPRTTFVRGAY
jgi:hypothetical protein